MFVPERNKRIKKELVKMYGYKNVRVQGSRGTAYGWVSIYIKTEKPHPGPCNEEEARRNWGLCDKCKAKEEKIKSEIWAMLERTGLKKELGIYYDDFNTKHYEIHINVEFKEPETQPAGDSTYKIEYQGTWTWIYFSQIPPEEVREAIKKVGFRFSRKRKAWYLTSYYSEELLRDLLNQNGLKESTQEADTERAERERKEREEKERKRREEEERKKREDEIKRMIEEKRREREAKRQEAIKKMETERARTPEITPEFSKVNKELILSIVKDLSRFFNVPEPRKIRFTKRAGGGVYKPWTKSISLPPANFHKNHVLNVLLHEFSHHLDHEGYKPQDWDSNRERTGKHDLRFILILRDVVTAFYGTPYAYNWKNDYKHIFEEFVNLHTQGKLTSNPNPIINKYVSLMKTEPEQTAQETKETEPVLTVTFYNKVKQEALF